MSTVAPGRIVLYKLNEGDVAAIELRRKDMRSLGETLETNPFRFMGNSVAVGQEYPAVIVQVFSPSEAGTANLQVTLDGYDTYWATSRYNVDSDHVRSQQKRNEFFADGKGCYRFPVVVPRSTAIAAA